MKGDRIVRWFMPKEERFKELLAKDTESLVKSSRVFKEIAFSESLEERRVKMVQLKDLIETPPHLDEVARRLEQALRRRLGYTQ